MSDDLVTWLREQIAWSLDYGRKNAARRPINPMRSHEMRWLIADCESKSAILRMHEPVPFWGNNPPPLAQRTPENVKAYYCECQCPDGVIEGTYPCETVRLLASAFRHCPGYREEWKP